MRCSGDKPPASTAAAAEGSEETRWLSMSAASRKRDAEEGRRVRRKGEGGCVRVCSGSGGTCGEKLARLTHCLAEEEQGACAAGCSRRSGRGGGEAVDGRRRREWGEWGLLEEHRDAGACVAAAAERVGGEVEDRGEDGGG